MSFLSNPKLPPALRIAQLLFGLGFLILLVWCNQLRGYWTNLQSPVTLGVVTFFFTLLFSAHGIWAYFKSTSLSGALRVVHLVLEIIGFLMWIGTATLMLRSQDINYNVPIKLGPPLVQWDLGIAFVFIEIVTFIATTILDILNTRSGCSATSASAV